MYIFSRLFFEHASHDYEATSFIIPFEAQDPLCNFSILPPFSRWLPNITEIVELTKTRYSF